MSRQMGPLPEDHPLVKDSEKCPVCYVTFQKGDMVTLIPTVPASLEEAKKAQAGRPCNYQAAVVHWNCRGGS